MWSRLGKQTLGGHKQNLVYTRTSPSWVALHSTLFILSGVISPLISSSILGNMLLWYNTRIECWIVQSPSHGWFFVTPKTAVHQTFLSCTISQSLLSFMPTESVMLSNHLILCRPLLLLALIFSSIKVFSRESALHIGWPKYWSFSFSISPSNEYSGLISFRIDWFDILAVQGTFKSLLQHHNT